MNEDMREELPNLRGSKIEISEEDAPEEMGGANISVLFSNGVVLKACYWRMIGIDRTILSSFDHKQNYGNDEPIDAKKVLGEFLNAQTLVTAELDRKSCDLHFSFSNGTNFEVFGFTNYEIWELHFPDGAVEYSNNVDEKPDNQ